MIILTKIRGVPEKAAAVPGMAHFAGSGPPDKTCRDCKHRGYRRRSLKEHWDAVTGQSFDKFYHWAGCAMYRKLTGRHGRPIEDDNRACKYFEELTKA